MPTVLLDIIGTSRISIGERMLHPSSPLLFSAALYLCVESGRDISREELQQLLFGSAVSRSARSHNLRQLLYRLTCAGVPLDTRANLVRVDSRHVRSAIENFRCLGLEMRAELAASAFTPLPGYSPLHSRAFEDWVEDLRASLQRRVRKLLEDDLAALQRASEWRLVALTARALLTIDPGHFAALKALVDALVIRGEVSDALAAIDNLLEDFGDTPSQARTEAQRLRRWLCVRQRRASPSPFVGREDKLAELSQLWERAERGTTQYVVISGPAGIGKTRLGWALRDLVASRGTHVLEHSCGDNDTHRPLSFFAHLSAQLLAMPGSLGVSPAAYSHITRLSLGAAPREEGLSDAISSEIVRSELHDALVDLFDAVSSETPLLVLIDDVHLLDPASWAVLRMLSERVRARPAMLLLLSRSTAHIRPHFALSQARVIALARLSDAESRSLLLALAPDRAAKALELDGALRLAAGNPFYLRAIARHTRFGTGDTGLPHDISSLAASSYHSLDEPTRTVMECVLVLKDLATLPRVRSAALVDEATFMRSLRLLEEDGLIHCVGQDIRCSHELLADALRSLVPTTVDALLRERVAAQLETESIARGFDSALAWAAADAWLALGNSSAAARLLRRCAAHAARVAEHAEAARILCRFLAVQLPTEEAAPLLDELISYAEVGGERSIRARALRERLRMMETAQASLSRNSDVSALRVAVAEADLNEAGDLAALVAESRSVLLDGALEPELRTRAGVSLTIAADLGLDLGLAIDCWQALSKLGRVLGAEHTQVLRAKLIFHTVFGNRRIALRTARHILRLHPLPRIDVESVIARRNALFALQILGDSVVFKPIAAATYAFMLERKIYTEAVYVAVTLAEDAIALGDFPTTLDWLRRASEVISRLHESAEGVTQGYMSALSNFAVHAGDYALASKLLSQVQKRLRLAATPRLRAINSAYLIRLAVVQGLALPPDCDLDQLRRDYEAGCRLGRQDTVVEGLWLAYWQSGSRRDASHMLRDYFSRNRREVGFADWSLWNSTKPDPFWKRHARLIPQTKHHHAECVDMIRSIVSRCMPLQS